MSNCYADLNMNSFQVKNVTTPTADTDGVTKLMTDTNAIDYIRCENTVSGSTTTDFSVADPARAVAQLTGSSTIVGSFSVSGNGIQCDFTGTALFSVNMIIEGNGGFARQEAACRLRRTRSAVTTEVGPISTCDYIRNQSYGIDDSSVHFNTIQPVVSGDLFEVVAYRNCTTSNPMYLSSTVGSCNFCAFRIG